MTDLKERGNLKSKTFSCWTEIKFPIVEFSSKKVKYNGSSITYLKSRAVDLSSIQSWTIS